MLSGLTLPNVKWSWTHFHDTNWIPFTFMSLMADTSLYGFHPVGYHLTNILLHAANSMLLYLALAAATDPGERGRGRSVRAAPAACRVGGMDLGRKDVLSTFFGFLSLFYYVRYATRGRLWRLGVSALFFISSLLSKQTFVTLPFLLLLLDYWPLGRLGMGTGRWGVGTASASQSASARDRAAQDLPTRDRAGRSKDAGSKDAGSKGRSSKGVATVESATWQKQQPLSRLILEKLPFFVLSAGFSAIAMAAQTGSVISLHAFPFPWRLENAICVYVAYLEKTLFPHNLAVFYPLSCAT